MDKTKFLLNKIRTLIKYIKVLEHKIMMKKNVKNEIVFKIYGKYGKYGFKLNARTQMLFSALSIFSAHYI